MSNPIRYDYEQAELNKSAGFYVRNSGHWVKWEDYAMLKARVNSLSNELEETRGPLKQYEEHFEYAKNVITNLENEVKSLKALDSLKTISLTDSTNWKAIGAYAEAMEENIRLKKENEKLNENPTSRILREERDNNSKLKKEIEFLKKQYSESVSHFREMRIENESLNKKVERISKWMNEIFEDAEARMDSGQLVGFKLLNIKRKWEIEKNGKPNV